MKLKIGDFVEASDLGYTFGKLKGKIVGVSTKKHSKVYFIEAFIYEKPYKDGMNFDGATWTYWKKEIVRKLDKKEIEQLKDEAMVELL